ncbi:hypothetical protein Agub_g3647 [Astrephomene gubernaculifera]|uniref:Ankyrin repeat domain-containing protein n=1 Tax=Astrephomene gubernaculifera TaxID=47775 RepID=A0AAD3DKB0_9CHLO|nr:hypothetical protein Agub_g3647 [Astrephomene gubernaculifera]
MQKSTASTGSQTIGGTTIWIPDIVQRVVSFLPINEVACTIRLLNKATAAQLRSPIYTAVRLSQPVPIHAFAWRWGSPDAVRSLTFDKRLRLLGLTAASGSLTNLQIAVETSGCVLAAKPCNVVFGEAAASGHVHVCEWLKQQGCPMDGALPAAARTGQRAACEWLLAHDCPWSDAAVCLVAGSGNMALLDWFLSLRQGPRHSRTPRVRVPPNVLFIAAIAGMPSLSQLQQLHQTLLNSAPLGEFESSVQARMVAAAAGSLSPDWHAKVEWLEMQGCRGDAEFARNVAARPDAADYLGRLLRCGCPVNEDAAAEAAERGDVATLALLASYFPNLLTETVARRAARAGHLETLQWLHAHGCRMGVSTVRASLHSGRLQLVAWLQEVLGLDLRDAEAAAGLMRTAAHLGNVELMAWLRERGCGWGDGVFVSAAEGGCEEAMEWLAAQGCPIDQVVPMRFDPYIAASQRGDMATLRCMRRLGRPWSTLGDTFTDCVDSNSPLPVLRWLLEEHCPLDIEAAERAVRRWWSPPERSDLLRRLGREQRQRQPRAEGRCAWTRGWRALFGWFGVFHCWSRHREG